MSEPVYCYVYCRSCGVKQYLGANLYDAVHLSTDLLTREDHFAPSTAVATMLRGNAASMEILLKFLTLHQEHRLGFWTTASMNEAPGVFPEVWAYSEEHNDILVPSWEAIRPLGEDDESRAARRDVSYWRGLYEQMYPTFMDLRIQLEPDERQKMTLRSQMRSWAEEKGWTLQGDNAVEDPSRVVDLPTPPSDPMKARALQLADDFTAEEDIDEDV